MDNDYILYQILPYLSFKDWILYENVCSIWQRVLSRQWRTVKTLRVGNDLFYETENPYPTKLTDKDVHLISHILKRCGKYLITVSLAPVNAKEPFFRNVRRFTAKYELNENLISNLCHYCVQLRKLDLSYHIFTNWSTFERLTNFSATLEILLLEICRLDDNAPSVNGMNNLMNLFFHRMTNLKTFSLRGSCYGYWIVRDNDFSNLPNSITYLDLSHNFTAKIHSIRNWISNLIHLRQLHLERTSMNDEDLLIFIQTCANTLRGLTLAYAKEIRNFAFISSFIHLKYLRLDGNRDHLDDYALRFICRSCTKLKLFSIENCNTLTHISLIHIASFKYLRHLSASSIVSMNDNCLIEICRYCLKLESVEIKYCKKLTRISLVHLMNLSSLRYLGVSGLDHFDQSIAECLRFKCTKLCAIEAFNCYNYR